MIAVLTKWQKNAPDSISWPNTLSFRTTYSDTNLPPGFTLAEYTAFISYLNDLTTTQPLFNLLTNTNVDDGEGNIINTRIFVDDTEYITYKALSDASEVKRNELIASFNLTRTVKVFNDDAEVISIFEKSNSYTDLNDLIVV